MCRSNRLNCKFKQELVNFTLNMNRHKTGKSKGGILLSEIFIWHSVKIKVRFLEKKGEREKELTDPKLENKI